MANKKKKKVNSVPAEEIAADMNPAGNAQPSAEEVSKSLAEGLKDIPPLTETQELPEKTAEEMTLSAVLDGADSIMLTGETAAGKYPIEAMKYLVKTGEEALAFMG